MHDWFDFLGIKASIIAAGLFGGLLRAMSRKRFKLCEIVLSPLCGALAAAYLTVPAVHYATRFGLPLPGPELDIATTHAAAFMIGACAMWICDILFEVIVRKINPHAGDA